MLRTVQDNALVGTLKIYLTEDRKYRLYFGDAKWGGIHTQECDTLEAAFAGVVTALSELMLDHILNGTADRFTVEEHSYQQLAREA